MILLIDLLVFLSECVFLIIKYLYYCLIFRVIKHIKNVLLIKNGGFLVLRIGFNII